MDGQTDKRMDERTDSLLELAGFYPAAKNFSILPTCLNLGKLDQHYFRCIDAIWAPCACHKSVNLKLKQEMHESQSSQASLIKDTTESPVDWK